MRTRVPSPVVPSRVLPRLAHGRLAAAAAAAACVVVATAVPAAAHVTVSSPDAVAADYGKIVFRVPNESAAADTTKVTVQLPAETPFASVSTRPVPGWRVQAEPTRLPEPVQVQGATMTEAVTEVTWTAQPGSALPPGTFTEFELSVGPFPAHATTLTFPTTQTYSDGEVVRWNQPVPPGGAEPEHPAPTLAVPPATGDGHGAAVAPVAETAPAAEQGSDPFARGLGAVAVLLAAAALLWSVRSSRRARG
jgi:periplasmic copper chaperone A